MCGLTVATRGNAESSVTASLSKVRLGDEHLKAALSSRILVAPCFINSEALPWLICGN